MSLFTQWCQGGSLAPNKLSLGVYSIEWKTLEAEDLGVCLEDVSPASLVHDPLDLAVVPPLRETVPDPRHGALGLVVAIPPQAGVEVCEGPPGT